MSSKYIGSLGRTDSESENAAPVARTIARWSAGPAALPEEIVATFSGNAALISLLDCAKDGNGIAHKHEQITATNLKKLVGMGALVITLLNGR